MFSCCTAKFSSLEPSPSLISTTGESFYPLPKNKKLKSYLLFQNEKADILKTLDPNLKNEAKNLYYYDKSS
jgi:hypothetical protein